MNAKYEIGQRVFIPKLNKHGVINLINPEPDLDKFSYEVFFEDSTEGWFFEQEICESCLKPEEVLISCCDEKGMTLRDYFAAMAMQGFVSKSRNAFVSPKLAYALADLMMEERLKSKS